MTGNEEENHWPGYVDALTTMTMMLIFIMTILAIAIFGLSQNVSRGMVEKIAKVVDLDVADPQEATEKLAERVVQRLETLSRETDVAQKTAPLRDTAEPEHKVASSEASPRPAESKDIRVERTQAFMTVNFQKRATGIDAEASERIKGALNDERSGQRIIEMRAYASRETSVSDARRVAFYRLLNLRTELVRMGISPDRIKARIEDTPSPDNGDLVRIELASAG